MTRPKDGVSLANVRKAFGMTQAQVAEEIGIPQGYVSSTERGRPVPSHAQARIEAWIDSQTAEARK
jgi:transcriptional regulator with XRE-family HTH domain